MASLRATSFFNGTYSGAGPVNLYTVPAGHRIILKEIAVYNFAGVSVPCTIALPGPATIFSRNLGSAGSASAQINQAFWLVLDPGAILQGYAAAGRTIACFLSGSLLYI